MNSIPGRLKIGFIGAGKVGVVIAAALRAVEHEIIGINAGSQASQDRVDAMLPGVKVKDIETIIAEADLVFLTIPDDVLPEMASGLTQLKYWKAGQLVVHTSGRYGISVLGPVQELGAIPLAIHPAMSFTGTSLDMARLNGCGFAVTAATTMLPIAQALVLEIGGEPRIVLEKDRPLYHAALVHAANHTTTILAEASQLLEKIGINDVQAYLGPLVQANVDYALGMGFSALTGPLIRGDVNTVTSHIHALQGTDMLENYKNLARATLHRIQRAEALPSDKIRLFKELLEKS